MKDINKLYENENTDMPVDAVKEEKVELTPSGTTVTKATKLYEEPHPCSNEIIIIPENTKVNEISKCGNYKKVNCTVNDKKYEGYIKC